jgi:hypothetical protein
VGGEVIELLCTKSLGRLIPSDAIGMDALKAIAEGSTVTARLTQTRNIKFHRLWYALLQTVFEAQTLFTSLDEMHSAIKLGIGFSEEIVDLDGAVHTIPKSISFAKLDEDGFRAYFDRAVDLIITKILPRVSRGDLEQCVFEILGEPTPTDIAR